MVNFFDKRLYKFIGSLCIDNQQSTIGIRHDTGRYTIRISFIFTNIRHQTATEIASEQGNQNANFQIIRMASIQRKHSHANSTLHCIGTLDKNTFLRRSYRNIRQFFRFAEIFTERFTSKKSFNTTDSVFADLPRKIDTAISGMIISVVKRLQDRRVNQMIIFLLH